MTKSDQLKALEVEMSADGALPLAESNLVFGEGSPDCHVLFIGEAPGFNENEQRRPFVGRAGQLLRQAIRDIGWREEDVYITNIVKRRPPDNRDPLPEEIEAYKPYLTRQIGIIEPKVIVPLGRFAMNYFLPEAKITRDQGRIFRVDDRLVVPMFHPAAALRAPAVLEAFKRSMRELPVIVKDGGLPVELPPAREATPPKPQQPKLF